MIIPFYPILDNHIYIFCYPYVRFMQGLTENHTLWRGLPVKISYLLFIIIIVYPHRQSIWTSAVECSRDVEAMMTAAAIIDRTFVDI